jgi:hypothetical protein
LEKWKEAAGRVCDEMKNLTQRKRRKKEEYYI